MTAMSVRIIDEDARRHAAVDSRPPVFIWLLRILDPDENHRVLPVGERKSAPYPEGEAPQVTRLQGLIVFPAEVQAIRLRMGDGQEACLADQHMIDRDFFVCDGGISDRVENIGKTAPMGLELEGVGLERSDVGEDGDGDGLVPVQALE